jgi:hypothetical protein
VKIKTIATSIANKLGYAIVKDRTLRTTDVQNVTDLEPTTNQNPIQAHMFWAYGNFTKLEKLAAVSFMSNGFDLKIWTYGSIGNLPKGAHQFNAREVIPENRVFTLKNGSYAAFSDLFRYAVLSQYGGLWADTDVICLTSSSALRKIGGGGLLVTENTDNSFRISNNLIYHPNPKSGDLIDLAFAIADRFQVDKISWAELGPELLTTLVRAYPSISPQIMGPEFANPVNWWDCPHRLLSEETTLTEKTWFLHCFNELWRRSGTDKNSNLPKDSLLGKIFSRYAERL